MLKQQQNKNGSRPPGPSYPQCTFVLEDLLDQTSLPCFSVLVLQTFMFELRSHAPGLATVRIHEALHTSPPFKHDVKWSNVTTLGKLYFQLGLPTGSFPFWTPKVFPKCSDCRERLMTASPLCACSTLVLLKQGSRA